MLNPPALHLWRFTIRWVAICTRVVDVIIQVPPYHIDAVHLMNSFGKNGIALYTEIWSFNVCMSSGINICCFGLVFGYHDVAALCFVRVSENSGVQMKVKGQNETYLMHRTISIIYLPPQNCAF